MSRNKRRKDEYDLIYDYDEEDSRNYEELNESDLEERIEKLRGTIGRGDCVYCGAKNAMVYEGHICFVCRQCNRSIHEDLYYRWAAGEDIE